MRHQKDIQQRIAYSFKNAELLELALTHKSYANENSVSDNNERLEFLGDAVLNLVISGHLIKTCPRSTEGDLSKLRAAVVSEPALAEIARTINLGKYLLLGKGEELTDGRNKDSLLANGLEALIAAIYLDAGMETVETVTLRLFEKILGKDCLQGRAFDFKTKLQELCQEQLKQLPEYRVVSETGPDHLKQFTVELFINGEMYGRGTGRSKKEAEQRSAKESLKKLALQ